MILITGATGFVGGVLIKRLLNTKTKIKACYQSEFRKNQLLAVLKKEKDASLLENIIWIQGNINDLGYLEAAFENIELVYHCAAMIALDDSNNDLLYKTNIEGTANVVNCCLKKGVKQLVYVSSIAALGDPEGVEEIDENTPWNNDLQKTGYAYSKYRGELEVWRGMQEGLSAVIVNPGVILGYCHRSGPSKQFLNYVQRNSYFYTSGGTGFVHVDDVVDAMIELASKKTNKERFVLVAENLSYKEFLSTLKKENQLKSKEKFITKSSLKILWVLDTIVAFLGLKKKVFSQGLLNSLTTNASYNGKKIKKVLPKFKYTPLTNSYRFRETT